MEKLLASADELVMTGEFEPKDIYAMTKDLEEKMTVFLKRVEKRKNMLDLSVLFHTHVIEVRNYKCENSLSMRDKEVSVTVAGKLVQRTQKTLGYIQLRRFGFR